MDVDADDNNQSSHPSGMVNGIANGDSHKETEQITKSKLRLTYEEYRRIANLIVVHMRKEEERLEDGNKALLLLA